MTFEKRMIAGLGLMAAAGLALPGLAAAADTPAVSPPTMTSPGSGSHAAMPSGTSSGSTMAPSGTTTSSGGSAMAPAGTTGSANASAAEPSKPDVLAAQKALKSQGENVSTDGVWGPATQAALRHFQQANGLTATGALDAPTRAKLNMANSG